MKELETKIFQKNVVPVMVTTGRSRFPHITKPGDKFVLHDGDADVLGTVLHPYIVDPSATVKDHDWFLFQDEHGEWLVDKVMTTRQEANQILIDWTYNRGKVSIPAVSAGKIIASRDSVLVGDEIPDISDEFIKKNSPKQTVRVKL